MAKQEKSGLLQGTLDMLVLKTLQSGPQHGYQITRWLELTSDQVLSIEEGSLYPALHRMERRGWIESEWGRSESNRRAKFYKLTRAGRAQLTQEVNAWDAISEAIARVLQNRSPSPNAGIER